MFFYKFIHQTDLLLTCKIKEILSPFNLSPEQLLIMKCLWEEDGINQTIISDKLIKDKTGITRMLMHLEKKGFIYKVVPENNRRISNVFLTEKGKQLEQQLIKTSFSICEKVSYGLTEKEINNLIEILTKIQNNLNNNDLF
ncbi:MarR family transcriptional regulator [Candidatus Arsenophonus nilaparvatae]|uniref:MarR family winged helix-turn-helix transcriptional regulator n=1 Tax=Candidatus Arsenophonus nilaparvatae TaxID=1247023 RepID=UPI0006902B24|nr:MarR family transcriptional regulator [Candidatus Arsenophonus nilaparvatae]